MSFDSRTSGVEQQLFATSVQGNILKIMLLSVLLLMLVFAQRFENNDVSLFVKKSQKHKTTMDYHTGGGTLFIPYWLLRNVTAGILKSSVQYSFFFALFTTLMPISQWMVTLVILIAWFHAKRHELLSNMDMASTLYPKLAPAGSGNVLPKECILGSLSGI